MEPGTERRVSQKTARRVSFEVQKSSRPCENSARRSRTRKSGRAFAASDRSEPEKSSKTEFCATFFGLIGSFRTVCKFFAPRFAVNDISGLRCAKNGCKSAPPSRQPRRHSRNPKCPLHVDSAPSRAPLGEPKSARSGRPYEAIGL